MSTDSIRTPLSTADASSARSTLRDLGETSAVLAVATGRLVSFWVASLLPLAYVPLLAAGVPQTHPTAFAGLLGANALAFVLGHGHRRDDA